MSKLKDQQWAEVFSVATNTVIALKVEMEVLKKSAVVDDKAVFRAIVQHLKTTPTNASFISAATKKLDEATSGMSPEMKAETIKAVAGLLKG